MVRSSRTPSQNSSLRDATAQYNAVKSLIAQKQLETAVQNSWKLYNQLCQSCGASAQRGSGGDEDAACAQGSHPHIQGPHPQLGRPSGDVCSKQRAALLVGTIMSLLISVVELQRPASAAETLHALIQPLGVLPEWLRYDALEWILI
jgi:hypothetical protein